MEKDITLTTPRLVLRQFTPGDFDAVHAYAGVYENVRYMDWGPNTPEATLGFLELTIKKALADPRSDYDFAVTLRSTGALIGGCGLYLNPGRFDGSLGWILHRDYWKNGYGTELAAELIRLGFETLGLHRMNASCFAANYGSRCVMERNGMRREAEFRQNRKGRPIDEKEWYDSYIYAILRGEWSSQA